MFGNDRNQLRLMYKTTWEKFQQQQPLSALESQIAEVIKEHPEYQHFISQLHQEFHPEMGQVNPFLHMGMHLGLREQLTTNRPSGIRDIYQKILTKTRSPHDTEHQMMDCLGEAMWSAQQNNTAPDEKAYLKCLKKLTK